MKPFGLTIALATLVSAAAFGVVQEIYTSTESQIRRVRSLGDAEGAQVVYPRVDREYSLAVGDIYVYWSTLNEIYRGDIHGGSREKILEGRESTPFNLVISPADARIFWIESGEESHFHIYSAGLDGDDVQLIVTRPSIGAIAFDGETKQLYWLEPAAGTIMRSGLGGENVETAVPPEILPEGPWLGCQALTVANTVLYFSGPEEDGKTQLFRLDTDGSTCEEVLPGELWSVSSVSLYFSQHDEMLYIYRGGNPWTNPPLPQLCRFHTQCMEREFFLWPFDMAFESPEEYYHGNIAIVSSGSHTQAWFVDTAGIKKKALPSMEVTVCNHRAIGDLKLLQGSGANANRLIWSSGWNPGNYSIYGMDTDGGEPATILSGLQYVSGIALDAENGHLYWSNSENYTIHRASISGEDVIEIVPGACSVGSAEGLVVDGEKGVLYWVDRFNGIKYCNMHSGVSGYVTTSCNQPRWLALDSARETLYFSDASGIHSVATDGSSMMSLTTWPGGHFLLGDAHMQLDTVGGKLYYSLTNNLWRLNLDGTDLELLGVLCGSYGTTCIALNIHEYVLTIIAPPRVAVGSPVTFRVGNLPTLIGAVTYEWYKDGVLIASANGAAYTIPSVTHADAGEYQLRITDESKGLYLSAPFILTVVDALPAGGLLTMALLLGVLLLVGGYQSVSRRI